METADTLTLRDVAPPVATPAPAVAKTNAIAAGIANVQAEVTKFDQIAAGLRAIETAHPKNVIVGAIDTSAGMKVAEAGWRAYRNPRLEVERSRKAAKQPVLALGRAIDDFAGQLETTLREGEDHYKAQIDAEEARKAAEKAEAARIEEARKETHRSGIANIRCYLDRCRAPGMTSARIANGIASLKEMTFTVEKWQDFVVQAASAQCETLEAMRLLHAETLAREQAAAAAEAQRVENARVAAELAEQRRKLELAAAEVQRQANELTAQRAEAERLEREAEARRVAREREETEAENRRLREQYLRENPPVPLVQTLPASLPAVVYGESLGTIPMMPNSATATVRDPTPEERAAWEARQAAEPTLVMSDDTTQPENSAAVAGPVQRAVRPLVERLRLRTLVQHGGPRGMDYGWNLQVHDSELHRDAAECLLELLRWKSIHALRLEALEGLLRTAQQEAHAGREAVSTLASERAANALLTGSLERLRTVASQVLRDMKAQGALLEWQTLLDEALRA